MLLTRSGSQDVEFEARTPTGALALGGVLLGVMGALCLVAPAPYTASRIAAAAVLFVAAVLLVARAMPRSRLARLDLSRQRLLLPDGTELDVTGARALALTGAPQAHTVDGRHSYRVELELDPVHREVLLEHDDPAPVVNDLRALAERLDLPVRAGWGLPEGATPWLPPAPRSAERRPPAVELRFAPFPAQRAAGVTIAVGATAIGAIMLLMYLARLERGAETDALSLVLGAVTVLVLFVLAAVLLTDRFRLSVRGGDIELERRTLGLSRSRRAFRSSSLRNAWAVSPGPGEPHHVLVQTTTELFSVPCVGTNAQRVASTLLGRT